MPVRACVPPQLGLYAELYAYAKGLDDAKGYAAQDADSNDFFLNVLHLCQEARDDIFPKTFKPAAEKRVQGKLTSRRASMISMLSSTTSPPPASMTGGGTGEAENPGPDGPEASVSFKGDSGAQKLSVAQKGVGDTALVKPKAVGASGEFELFGMLVEQTEAMIDEDEALRQQLAASVEARRALLLETRSTLTNQAKRAVVGASTADKGKRQFQRLLGKKDAKKDAATDDGWSPSTVQV